MFGSSIREFRLFPFRLQTSAPLLTYVSITTQPLLLVALRLFLLVLELMCATHTILLEMARAKVLLAPRVFALVRGGEPDNVVPRRTTIAINLAFLASLPHFFFCFRI